MSSTADISERKFLIPGGGRPRLTPEAASRHTTIVRRLRLLTPAVAIALVVTYMLSATPPRVDRSFFQEFSAIDTSSTSMRLNAPRHVGYDLEGNLFEVAANSAERDPNAPGLVSFDAPRASRGAVSGEQLDLSAGAGTLDTDRNRLDLSGDVRLGQRFGKNELLINTEAASVDFDAGTVTTTTGIFGESETGTVAADSMTSYQNEGRVVFEGDVRLQLTPQKPQP